MRLSFFLVSFFSLFFYSFTTHSTTNEGKSKDTVVAITAAKNINTASTNYVEFIEFKKAKVERMTFIIDSLLELPGIPKQILTNLQNQILELNQINIANNHPADDIYGYWENEKANPYDLSKIAPDSLMGINLLVHQNDFSIPFDGVVTSKFGYREGKLHKGIDIDLDMMDSVVASFSGKVRVAKNYGGFGKVVIIRHYNGLETIYAHLQKIKVKPDQEVKAGEIIGLGGNTGHSSGTHLHFECRFMGEPLDPEIFISFQNKELTTNELTIKRTNHGFACFPKGAEFHVVQKGDYLAKIANEYGISIEKICELNNIRRSKMLRVGEELRII